MPQAHILLNSYSLNGIASSTNQFPGASAPNILNYRPSKRYRSNNLTTVRITLDAGSSLPWDTVFLGYHNGYDGTVNISSDNNSANLFTTPSYLQTGVPLRYPGVGEFISWHTWHHTPTTQIYRYMGIQINDTNNPDGFFSAGILYVGNLFTPTLHADIGSSRGYVDTSIPLQMANGERVIRRRPRKASQRLSWRYLNEMDSHFFSNMQRIYGESTPIVVKTDPEDPIYGQNLIIYGFAEYRDGGTISSAAPYGYDSVEMTITEV